MRSLVAVDRPGREVVAVTVWADVAGARDALDAVQTGVSDVDVPPSAAILGEPAHFDIGSTWMDRGGDAAFLRVAIGRFSRPSSDREMLDMLRARVPRLSEHMVMSAVGRRMLERSVEVLFFSGWEREPADHRLEAPFWPDISLRYDEFAVRVYVAPRVALLARA